jgi:CysZ protein
LRPRQRAPLVFPRFPAYFSPMLDAAIKALTDMLRPPLRSVLIKSILLALALIVVIGIVLQRVLASLADSGATWAEQSSGFAPHAAWAALAWFLSIMATLGIVTGAVFLMPAVTNVVGSFFVDDVADAVERAHYPVDLTGLALPIFTAVVEGLKFALLSVLVYVVALPFVLFAGFGVLILFVANSYLLGRNFFELAAMRFYPPWEAKLLRKRNAGYVFFAGMFIAAFVSIPIVNLATPVFAMAFMVHIHKRVAGKRAELIEPRPKS